MKLPNAEHAYVAPAKILDYLLSMESPRGKSKARFFTQFGFSADRWQQLANALRIHGVSHEVTSVTQTQHGTRFTVDGELQTLDGRNPHIRTAWIIRNGSEEPRLITAHPRRR